MADETKQEQTGQEQGKSDEKNEQTEFDDLFHLFHKMYLFGLGVQRDIEDTVRNLIERGEKRADDQQKVVDDFMKRARENTGKIEEKFNEMINKTLETMRFVPKEKYDALERRVQVLESKVLELEQRMKEQQA